MPAPIVIAAIWGVAALATAGGIALVALRLVKILANKKLAILGAQKVGKTTLFQMLRDGKVSKVSGRTVDAEPGTEFILRISGKDIRFEIPSDVTGNDGAAYPEWRKAFAQADFVLYLFRADEFVAGIDKTVKLVSDHLSVMKVWLDAHRGSPPKIVLVGTFADQWPGFPQKRQELAHLVADSDVIKAAVVKLNNAGLVVGSLANTRLAGSVIKGIEKQLS